jgi:hypothetical protein
MTCKLMTLKIKLMLMKKMNMNNGMSRTQLCLLLMITMQCPSILKSHSTSSIWTYLVHP